MLVFTSFDASMIDLSRTSAEAVKDLVVALFFLTPYYIHNLGLEGYGMWALINILLLSVGIIKSNNGNLLHIEI